MKTNSLTTERYDRLIESGRGRETDGERRERERERERERIQSE